MTLCYQAYGSEEILSQTMFSIVSYLHHSPLSDGKVIIYTDRQDTFVAFFQNHPRVTFVPITSDNIRKWRGKIDFVHRVKLEVLKDCGARFGSPLLYLDSDTYFLCDPQSLFESINVETALMHVAEAQIDQGRNSLSKKIAKFLRKNKFEVAGSTITVAPSTIMWNAGVIGLAERHKDLLPKMIELTDAMYMKYQKHVMEQLAVSYYLQNYTKLQPCDAVVYHYWNQKPEYQALIKSYLSSYPTVFAAIENYSQFKFPRPPQIKQKVSLLQRMLGA